MDNPEEHGQTQSTGYADPRARRARELIRARLFGEARPVHIGGFSLLGEIGRGGMGVVYLAYDEELDRRVAIKVLDEATTTVAPRGSPDAVQTTEHHRLVREAQAVARVTHPNVVTVYEVGTDRGQVFIVMEFVEGQPLSQWAAGGVGWRDVVTMYLQAGRGLAAAHAAGLVHRDFKPENVLVGRDGRARVVDFGLARPDTPGGSVDDGRTSDDMGDVTPCTGVAGTPAYMAPEVFDGRPPDAAADQFSFCASLWESLYGTRPFQGNSLFELYDAKCAGELHPRSPGRDIPRSLRALVTRGLSPDPQARFGSIEALLRALERVLGTRRRRTIWLASTVMLTTASLLGYSTAATTIGPRCADAGASMDATWNETSRTRLHDGLAGSSSHLAADTAVRVVDVADAYARRWAEKRREACEATHVHGTQSERLLDLRMRCLDRSRAAFEAQIEVLGHGEPDVVENALLAMAKLPPIVACADLERLSNDVVMPADAASVEILDALEATRALARAGMFADADDRARALIEPARASGESVLIARALLEAGRHAAHRGDHARARELLTEAWQAALDGRDDETAVGTATVLVGVEGVSFASYEVARSWGHLGEAMIRRHRLGPQASVALREALGSVAISGGDLDDAHLQLGRALEAADAEEVPVVLRARVMSRLALVLVEAGEYERAMELSGEAWSLTAEALGMHHPQTAARKVRHASVLYMRDAYSEAQTLLEESIDDLLAGRSADSKEVGDALNLLGAVLEAQQRCESALDAYDRALAIYAHIVGDDHPDSARALDNSTSCLATLGRLDEAYGRKQQALEIFEATIGPDTPEVATAQGGLANIVRRQGRYTEAVELIERANAYWSERDANHPVVAINSMELAQIHGLEKRWTQALEASRRALEIRESLGAGPILVAEARLWVGMSTWKIGADPAGALRSIREARVAYADDPSLEEKLASIDEWLADEGVDLD